MAVQGILGTKHDAVTSSMHGHKGRPLDFTLQNQTEQVSIPTYNIPQKSIRKNLFQSQALLAHCYKAALKSRSSSPLKDLTYHGCTSWLAHYYIPIQKEAAQLHLPVSGLEYSRQRISESWASTFSISLRDCSSYILRHKPSDCSVFNKISKN